MLDFEEPEQRIQLSPSCFDVGDRCVGWHTATKDLSRKSEASKYQASSANRVGHREVWYRDLFNPAGLYILDDIRLLNRFTTVELLSCWCFLLWLGEAPRLEFSSAAYILWLLERKWAS